MLSIPANVRQESDQLPDCLILLNCRRRFCVCFRQANVTITEVNQYMNRWIPPIEFGMMHQLLFQMLLIPLTMSKRLLAIISTHSSTRTLFPYEDIVGFHIFLGYWFCWLLFVRT